MGKEAFLRDRRQPPGCIVGRLPANRRYELRLIHEEHHEAGAAREERVRDEQDLLGRGAVDEPVLAEFRRAEVAAALSGVPCALRGGVTGHVTSCRDVRLDRAGTSGPWRASRGFAA